MNGTTASLWFTVGALLAAPWLATATEPKMPGRSAPPAVTPAAERSPPPIANLESKEQNNPALKQAWWRELAHDQQDRLPLPVYTKVAAPEGTRVVFYSAGGSPHPLPTRRSLD